MQQKHDVGVGHHLVGRHVPGDEGQHGDQPDHVVLAGGDDLHGRHHEAADEQSQGGGQEYQGQGVDELVGEARPLDAQIVLQGDRVSQGEQRYQDQAEVKNVGQHGDAGLLTPAARPEGYQPGKN